MVTVMVTQPPTTATITKFDSSTPPTFAGSLTVTVNWRRPEPRR